MSFNKGIDGEMKKVGHTWDRTPAATAVTQQADKERSILMFCI